MPRLKVGRTVGNLGEYLREQRLSASLSLRQLAEQTGVSNPYLSQIERGLRRPSAEVLQQIAKALRISAETLYVQAGILEERVGDQEVDVAILGDPTLTERQKRVLLDIYESFRAENAASADRAAADAAEESAAAADAAEESAAAMGSQGPDAATTHAVAADSRRLLGCSTSSPPSP